VNGAGAGLAIAPDGGRLYAFNKSQADCPIVVLDPVTLQSLARLPVRINGLSAVTCSLHPPRVYAVGAGDAAELTIIDASSDNVIAALPLAKPVSPPPDLAWLLPPGLAADDKYVYIKVQQGPNSLIVLNAQTHEVVWSSGNAYTSSANAMALSGTRLSYIGDDRMMVLEIDKQPLQPKATQATGFGTVIYATLGTTVDNVHQFLKTGGVTVFDGPEWQNPNPIANSQCDGMAVTTDGMQALSISNSGDGRCFVQVLELGPGSKSPAGTLLTETGYFYAIALAPDNSRVFVARSVHVVFDTCVTALHASYS
jgi:hypothetical protein